MHRLLAVAVLLSLVAQLPLRLVLPAGLSARSITGSIWHGRMQGAAWQGVALGDLDIGLSWPQISPLAARLPFAGDQLRGTLWAGPVGRGADIVAADVPILLPGAGAVRLQLADAGLALGPDGACRSAGGQVRLTTALPWAGGPLRGSPHCDGGALVLALASDDGSTRLDLRSTATKWHSRLQVRGQDDASVAMLAAQGFQRQGAAMVMVMQSK